MTVGEIDLDGTLIVITHPLEIVSAGDGVSDGMVGADARQAFGVDDGTQGGVGMCGPGFSTLEAWADRPTNPFLMSVTPPANQIFVEKGTGITRRGSARDVRRRPDQRRRRRSNDDRWRD